MWYWSLLLRHHGYTGLCIHSHRCVRGDSPVDDWSDILQSSSTIQRQSLLANNNNNNRRTLIDNQVNSSILHVHSQLSIVPQTALVAFGNLECTGITFLHITLYQISGLYTI